MGRTQPIPPPLIRLTRKLGKQPVVLKHNGQDGIRPQLVLADVELLHTRIKSDLVVNARRRSYGIETGRALVKSVKQKKAYQTQGAFTAIVLFAFFSLLIGISSPHVADTTPVTTGLIDMVGGAVALSTPAKHSAMYAPVLRDYLALDRGPGHVLAAARFQIRQISAGLLGVVYPDTMKIAIAPTYGEVVPAEPEGLLRTRPDAVFCLGLVGGVVEGIGFARRSNDTQLARSGERRVGLVAIDLRGRRAKRRGQLLLTYSRQEADALMRDLPPIDPSEKPRVVYMSFNGPNDLSVATGDYFMTRALRHAGGQNAASALASSRIDLEELLLLNPDVIFVDWRSGGRISPRALYAMPALQPLAAVRRRRIYVVPHGGAGMDSIIERPLLEERWMAELLYPSTMPKAFRRRLKETYREVYAYGLSDKDIDATIYRDENMASAGFERFIDVARLPSEK